MRILLITLVLLSAGLSYAQESLAEAKPNLSTVNTPIEDIEGTNDPLTSGFTLIRETEKFLVYEKTEGRMKIVVTQPKS